MTDAAVSPREGFQKLARVLLMGLMAMWLMTGMMTLAGAIPMLPDGETVGIIVAVVVAITLIVAWFWARPKVPPRPPMMPLADYWRDTKVSGAAALYLFLLEGSAVLGLVGTMMTGYWPTALVAVLPVIGMLRCTPESLEQRAS